MIATNNLQLYRDDAAKDERRDALAEMRARFSPYQSSYGPPQSLMLSDAYQDLLGHSVSAEISAGEWRYAQIAVLDAKSALEAAVVRLKTEEARVAANSIGLCVGLVTEQKRLADEKLAEVKQQIWDMEWAFVKGK